MRHYVGFWQIGSHTHIYIYIYICVCVCVRVKSAASAIRKIKHEARGRVLYFTYSTWHANDLSVIKNFLNIH